MGAFFHEMFQVGLYKRTQGRITRQVTCGALALVVLVAAYRLFTLLRGGVPASMAYGGPVLLLVLGVWASYRLVNLPRFADFLIAVEAEMNKVSWPTTEELIRSSIVVIFVIFFLAFILFGFDQVWMSIFRFLGVLRGS
jgi:preprotein translocase subunit SecE